ncbi:MAG TPA: hypothetical protein VHT74_02570 [Acetobacteraceae bacterium]|nr:hypothetical protein [Acetobacteraceae bacterium]
MPQSWEIDREKPKAKRAPDKMANKQSRQTAENRKKSEKWSLLPHFLNGVIDCHTKYIPKFAWLQIMHSDADAIPPAGNHNGTIVPIGGGDGRRYAAKTHWEHNGIGQRQLSGHCGDVVRPVQLASRGFVRADRCSRASISAQRI